MTRPAHGATGAVIAHRLREDILSGTYAPGERIRQNELAELFDASRLPVRDALRMLESEGLINLVANTGAWVSQLSLAECEEIYQIRERVEPLLLRYAAPHLDDEMLDRLQELALQMEGSSDVEDFLRRDREFHLLSYSVAETGMLGDLVHRLWNTTQHYRRAFALQLDRHSWRVVHDEHHMITTALCEDDIDGAERVLEGHIRGTRRELERHPEIFQTFQT